MTNSLSDQLAGFQRAVMERDVSLAPTFVDEDFALQLVSPAPARVPRAAWVAMLPDYVVHEWEVEEHQLDEDADVAVLLQRVRMRATVLGQDRSGVFVITDTWLRRPDGWRLWRRHSTPLTAGPMPGGSP
jgi:ketosteroid isomerase-like protein